MKRRTTNLGSMPGGRAVAAVVLLGLTASCASLRKPARAPAFQAPPVTVSFQAFAGSPLSGPTTAAVSIPPAGRAWRARITLTAVEHVPVMAGVAIDGKARLVVASRGGEPVSPSDRLLGAARWIDGAADLPGTGRSAPIDDRPAALIAGTTLALSAADSLDVPDPVKGGRASRLVGVMLYRPAAPAKDAGAYTVAVEWQDLYTPPAPYRPAEDAKEDKKAARPPPSTAPAAGADDARPKLTREMAVVDRTLSDDADAFTLVLPVRFTGTPAGGAVIARVEVRAKVDGDDPDQAAQVAATEKALAESRTAAARLGGMMAYGPAASSATDVALASLAQPAQRRKGLAFLAGQTGAKLCEDATLVADEATLAAMCDAVGRSVTALTPRPDGPALGWLLDRATFGVLGEQLAAERLSPELAAVLTAYAGEAGRHESSVELIAKAGANAATRDAFDAQLVSENLIYLEDNSPAARVRAYDWLAARHLAPAGYDPLAGARERRQALDRALSAPATAPAPPSTQPSVNPNNQTAAGGMP